ncbi:uncharacterized protein LOC124086049 isoform X2 [Marmota monax]|uniref:uncharacterized protein LOC124086049 isoform X2 n=1 Tax=Marmota monax TaxID=9995 RepID=UPI001EAFC27C|nr:uncharacterized protein LOC124086049 isoform X2 [Marmota monax]
MKRLSSGGSRDRQTDGQARGRKGPAEGTAGRAGRTQGHHRLGPAGEIAITVDTKNDNHFPKEVHASKRHPGVLILVPFLNVQLDPQRKPKKKETQVDQGTVEREVLIQAAAPGQSTVSRKRCYFLVRYPGYCMEQSYSCPAHHHWSFW